MNLWKWDLTRLELINWVQACLNMGVTTFDLADIYGDYTCENLFGRVLSAEPALRHQMQIITKCGIKMVSQNRSDYHVKHYDTSQQHILQSVENSLHQLITETIDVLLIHRPIISWMPARW
jgi:predicted oxidoreductase